MKTLNEVRLSLLSYLEEEKLLGFDPHDGLESFLIQKTFLKKSKFVKLLFLQLIKRSPLNFRSFLGIKKHRNPKAIALYLSSLCKMKLVDEKSENINFYIDELKKQTNPFYSEYAWGYPFDWQARAFFQKKNYPTVVASSFVGQALLDLYEETGKTEYLDIAKSTADFFLKHLNRTVLEDSFSFSYSPADKSVVFNATALGARHLARVYYYTNDNSYKESANAAIMPLIKYQQENGSWVYGLQSHHTWIDSFHSGYNLECLYETQKFLGHSDFDLSIKKGLDYYTSQFFEKDGTAKYYSDSRYPIDSHAPAQLLVTLYKLGVQSEYQELIQRVVQKWLSDLYSEKTALFYYQKKKYITNKINYLRWTQSWALYGLSFLDLNEFNFNS